MRLFFLLITGYLISGCSKNDYYAGLLDVKKLPLNWVAKTHLDNKFKAPVPYADLKINLFKDGSFEVENFPLVLDFYPSVKIKYVNERGTWTLIENNNNSLRYRWKLNMNFKTSRFITDLDVVGTVDNLNLFVRTDLDRWIGFMYSPLP